ncbi:MAG: hypothetical protein A2493_02770 [Candidatus Magasanikbacteria bacterium RIFOXYC12_FULL_33_11]|uniref:Uncharacterized protein n=1 Tax=Candidatus Magasanikbacteria bacterium RIFOXYC12_FULL_33_11 TaxID=1798701 RepID=A0A1F6NLX6_9BACT|nr:MAG: hypothetical protein A2493_02770 [Candidatus Magasanikbacteria bacterium RIFOXYC12_FULL_33_11]
MSEIQTAITNIIESNIKKGVRDFHQFFDIKNGKFRNERLHKDSINDMESVKKAIINAISRNYADIDWSDKKQVKKMCDLIDEACEQKKDRFFKAYHNAGIVGAQAVERWDNFLEWLQELRNSSLAEIKRTLDVLLEKESLQQSQKEQEETPELDEKKITQEQVQKPTKKTKDNKEDDITNRLSKLSDNEVIDELIEFSDNILILKTIVHAIFATKRENLKNMAADMLIAIISDIEKKIKENDGLTLDLEEAEAEVEESLEMSAELEEAINRAQDHISALRDKNQRLEKEKDSIEKDLQIKISQKEALIKAYEDMLDRAADKLESFETDDDMIRELVRNKETLLKKINLLEKTIAELEKNLEEAKTKKNTEAKQVDYSAEKDKLLDEIARIENSIQILINKSFELSQWIEHRKDDLDRKKREHRLLSGEHEEKEEHKAVALFIKQIEDQRSKIEFEISRLEKNKTRYGERLSAIEEIEQTFTLVDNGSEIDLEKIPVTEELPENLTALLSMLETKKPDIKTAEKIEIKREEESEKALDLFSVETKEKIDRLDYALQFSEEDRILYKRIKKLLSELKDKDGEKLRSLMPFDMEENKKKYYQDLIERIKENDFQHYIDLALVILSAMRRGKDDFAPRLAKTIGLSLSLKGVKIVETLGKESSRTSRSLLQFEILCDTLLKEDLLYRKNIGSRWGKAFTLTPKGETLSQYITAKLLEENTISVEQLNNIHEWANRQT